MYSTIKLCLKDLTYKRVKNVFFCFFCSWNCTLYYVYSLRMKLKWTRNKFTLQNLYSLNFKNKQYFRVLFTSLAAQGCPETFIYLIQNFETAEKHLVKVQTLDLAPLGTGLHLHRHHELWQCSHVRNISYADWPLGEL